MANTQTNRRSQSKSKNSSILSTRGVKASAKKILNQGDTTEGEMTAMVENQTGKLPSMTWLGLAVGSMAASALILATSQRKEYANFVGLWAPSFLLIGIYNKLVKLEGNDYTTAGGESKRFVH